MVLPNSIIHHEGHTIDGLPGRALQKIVAGTALVANLPLEVLAAAGVTDDTFSDTKFGRNSNVDSTGEDVWNGGGTYTGFPVGGPETVDVFSSSDTDGPGMSGALTVRIYGLKSIASTSYESEDLVLNGTTPVESAETWWRVNRVVVLTAGAGGANVGTITVRHHTTTANVFAVMPVGNNQTAIAAYTVPAGQLMAIRRVYCAGARANGTVLADMALLVREYGSVFRHRRLFTVGNQVSFHVNYAGGLVLPPLTDVKLRVISASASSGDFVGEFEFGLVSVA